MTKKYYFTYLVNKIKYGDCKESLLKCINNSKHFFIYIIKNSIIINLFFWNTVLNIFYLFNQIFNPKNMRFWNLSHNPLMRINYWIIIILNITISLTISSIFGILQKSRNKIILIITLDNVLRYIPWILTNISNYIILAYYPYFMVSITKFG